MKSWITWIISIIISLFFQIDILNSNISKKAIVVGASSGIGKEIAKELAKNGYVVGLVSRNKKALNQLQQEIPTQTYIKEIDVSEPDKCMRSLKKLIIEMNGLDLMVINAGVSFIEEEFLWENIINTIKVNVIGFCASALVAAQHFEKQKSGHIVGISSIAALRGLAFQPTYSASKAFISRYLEGLRNRFIQKKLPIYVTDIQPGYVDTPMLQHHIQNYIEKYKENPGLWWVCNQSDAAKQIIKAILDKKKHAYITKRWRLVAWLLYLIPDFIYNFINN